MKSLLAILITCLLLNSSCKKDVTEVYATVKDFTGFDGCRILLVLDSGERLEIVSLPPNTALIPDRRVAVKYKTVNGFSICMVGPTVEVTSLRYL